MSYSQFITKRDFQIKNVEIEKLLSEHLTKHLHITTAPHDVIAQTFFSYRTLLLNIEALLLLIWWQFSQK